MNNKYGTQIRTWKYISHNKLLLFWDSLEERDMLFSFVKILPRLQSIFLFTGNKH